MGWNPKYALLLAFCTAVTFFASLLLEKHKDKANLILVLALCVIFSLLLYYKYLNFLLELFAKTLSVVRIRFAAPKFDIVLPVGISFFTFQAAGYLIDVWRGEIRAERNFLRYALFVSFFPQLVAGPIERSRNLMAQFEEPRKFDFDRAKNGFMLILWGLFLKMVIADRAAIFVDAAYGGWKNVHGLILILATVMFAFQIYCDFYGYSIIAKGAAQILGITLMDNFNAPYLSVSVQEFWRRWHISLSTWFKDYVYIPLGGSRCSRPRSALNVIAVMLVSGAWHGAGLNFVAWGLFHGIAQVAERIAKPLLVRVPRFIRWAGTAFWTTVAWVFFRAESLKDSLRMLKRMAGSVKRAFMEGDVFSSSQLFQIGAVSVDDHAFELKFGFTAKDMHLLGFAVCILLIADFLKYKGISVSEMFCKRNPAIQVVGTAIAITFLAVFGIWGTAFDAANFIYFQF